MIWKTAALLLAGMIVLTGCNATRTPVVVVKPPPLVALKVPPLRWNIPVPYNEPLDVHGIANMDDAGLDMNALLYPGGNAGSFLVAVFTHAAIAGTERDNQKAELQKRADKVLTPYLPTLATFKYREIIRLATSQMTVEGDKALIDTPKMLEEGWLVTIEPTFLMTQDERAILMKGVVTLFSPEDRNAPYYRNLVRVVSLPVKAADPKAYWLDAGGERLQVQMATLVANGLDIVIEQATMQPTAEEEVRHTFRYMEGAVERVERAQLLDRTCDHILLKNLRGYLYLVPTVKTRGRKTHKEDAQCTSESRFF